MTHFLLIRHAVNDYVKTGRLAGRTPEVHLNEEGLQQAEALGERLAGFKFHQLISSPLERTMETAQAVQKHHPHLSIQKNDQLLEVDYGDWQGASIATLRLRKMWSVIQEYPSRAYFPNGEAMRDVQTRAVTEIERLAQAYPRDTLAVFSHADLIKMVMAHYLGMHLDVFQRIVIDPASICEIHLNHSRPYVSKLNDTAHLRALEEARKKAAQGSPASA
ncbi:MAG: MSMEG_4193 family putative phosphomutase [Phototrophicaceae bacterium]|jgi:probable phosphoglycerate mutase